MKVLCVLLSVGFDHINRNAPVLIRTPKLTRFEPAQYWGGGPPGNSVVLNPLFFFLPFLLPYWLHPSCLVCIYIYYLHLHVKGHANIMQHMYRFQLVFPFIRTGQVTKNKQQKTSNKKQATKKVIRSRFVRVILAQGPC
jgi:hypothetical protein